MEINKIKFKKSGLQEVGDCHQNSIDKKTLLTDSRIRSFFWFLVIFPNYLQYFSQMTLFSSLEMDLRKLEN